MFRALVAFSFCALLSSPAFGQVFYQPVQSQFRTGTGDGYYYYGGTDLRTHIAARSACPQYGYANNLHHFDGGNSFGQPSPMYDRTPVYTDCMPGRDAARFGYTAADAENEARANAARYFRKADELAAAIRLIDGARIVPPTPVQVYVTPVAAAQSKLPGEASRGQIIIIPKKYLDRPLKDFIKTPAKVAAAQ